MTSPTKHTSSSPPPTLVGGGCDSATHLCLHPSTRQRLASPRTNSVGLCPYSPKHSCHPSTGGITVFRPAPFALAYQSGLHRRGVGGGHRFAIIVGDLTPLSVTQPFCLRTLTDGSCSVEPGQDDLFFAAGLQRWSSGETWRCLLRQLGLLDQPPDRHIVDVRLSCRG